MTAALPDTLRSERLVLRRPTLADLEAYVAYYTGPRTGGVGGPKPRHIVVERFAAMVGQWALRGYGRYAITDGGTGFGHAGVMQIDDGDAPELTWTLWDASREGQGYATEAARAVQDAWHGPDLIVRIDPANAASLRVAQKLGYRPDPKAPRPAHDTRDVLTLRQSRGAA